MDARVLQNLVIMIPPLLLAITVHEVAHGYIAYRKGDYTAKLLGRLTLNPIRHIDPIGTVLFPLMLALSGTGVIFGWAKPVPVNSFNFKSPKKDMVLVSLAGPVSNFLLAMLFALLLRILLWVPGALLSCSNLGSGSPSSSGFSTSYPSIPWTAATSWRGFFPPKRHKPTPGLLPTVG
jgi:Zn-dependent protease